MVLELFLKQSRRDKTHEVQLTPHKAIAAVWGVTESPNKAIAAVWDQSQASITNNL